MAWFVLVASGVLETVWASGPWPSPGACHGRRPPRCSPPPWAADDGAGG